MEPSLREKAYFSVDQERLFCSLHRYNSTGECVNGADSTCVGYSNLIAIFDFCESFRLLSLSNVNA